MIAYVFSPLDESWSVTYVTGGLDSNIRLFINEIFSKKNGVTSLGLIPEAIVLGLWDEVQEIMAPEFRAKAIALGLNLHCYLNGELMTYGDEPTVVVPPTVPGDPPPPVGSSAAEFNWFMLDGQTTNMMNVCLRTITIGTIFGWNPAAQVAWWEASAGAKVYVGTDLQEKGVTLNDYTTPVTFTVVSENGLVSNNYLVTATLTL